MVYRSGTLVKNGLNCFENEEMYLQSTLCMSLPAVTLTLGVKSAASPSYAPGRVIPLMNSTISST